jgi:hypothetical protein
LDQYALKPSHGRQDDKTDTHKNIEEGGGMWGKSIAKKLVKHFNEDGGIGICQEDADYPMKKHFE